MCHTIDVFSLVNIEFILLSYLREGLNAQRI